MPRRLSVDLRKRVVAAVVAGVSCHRAAALFGVSVSRASWWSERFRHEGQFTSKAMGRDHTWKRLEARASLILRIFKQEPSLLLRELSDRLAERGVQINTSALSRFFPAKG